MTEASNQTAECPSSKIGLQLYDAEFIGEPGIGVTVIPNLKEHPWLSWKEVVDLHLWLGELINNA